MFRLSLAIGFAALTLSVEAQNRWMFEYGTTVTTPKFSIYSVKMNSLFIPNFGSTYYSEKTLKKFTILSDIGFGIIGRRKRHIIYGAIEVFNEKFNIGEQGAFVNNKSYYLQGVRNGLRIEGSIGYQILDKRGIQVRYLVGGNYDIVSWISDFNPINIIINSRANSSSSGVLVYDKYFLDNVYNIAKTGLLNTVSLTRSKNTYSLSVQLRDPDFSTNRSKNNIFENTKIVSFKWFHLMGYKIK